jgi:hypothetical protein
MPIPFIQIDQRALPLYQHLGEVGIPLNRELTESTYVDRQIKLVGLKQEINQQAGFEANPNRPKDLS